MDSSNNQSSELFVPNDPDSTEQHSLPPSAQLTENTNSNLESSGNVQSECTRINSESQFGMMETVSLETSVIETDNMNQLLKDDESINLDKTDMSESPIDPKTELHSQPESLLKKYFDTGPSKMEQADSDGSNFFDNLSKKPDDTGMVQSENLIISHQTLDQTPKIDSNLSCQNEISDKNITNNSTDSSNVQLPTLFKFFSEDKSCHDSNGKSFFDTISESNVTENFQDLKISESAHNSDSQNSFLSSPVGKEIEDAWLPSEKTRQILMAVVTSKSTISCDKSQFTIPSIVVDTDMADSVKSLLIECKSPIALQRQVLTADKVNPDEAGLQKLMEAGCYHAAINLTRHILIACGQGNGGDGKPMKHTPFSLRIWFIRLALFVKLRKYNLAEAESAAFGDFDNPDLYYEFYPDVYSGKRGTMVPFAFRLLLAELPQYQGNHQVTLDNLYRILNIIQKIIKNIEGGCAEDGSMIELSTSRKAASLMIWSARERRTLYSILNCVLTQKDYVLAVTITKLLISKSKDEVPQLYSALGRIFLQLGDVNYAQECFTKAVSMAQKISEDFQLEDNINKALLAVSQSNNEEAYKFYEKAYSMNPNNAMIVNNMAVCLLYMGKLKSALDTLEKTIHNNPNLCLHDGLLFNLCTLYELESSRCTEKKIAMLELLSKYVGDSFNISCLKIQSSARP